MLWIDLIRVQWKLRDFEHLSTERGFNSEGCSWRRCYWTFWLSLESFRNRRDESSELFYCQTAQSRNHTQLTFGNHQSTCQVVKLNIESFISQPTSPTNCQIKSCTAERNRIKLSHEPSSIGQRDNEAKSKYHVRNKKKLHLQAVNVI